MDGFRELLNNAHVRELVSSLQKGNFAENMQMLHDKMERLRVHGESGGGLVKTEINGHGQIMNLTIDKSILTPDDQALVESLCVAAVNIAKKNLKEEMALTFSS